MNGAQRRRVWCVTALCVAFGLGACASTPQAVLIALPSAARGGAVAPPSATAPAAAVPGGVLLVRRLSIPEYMVSRRVRYASGPARLAEWPDAYWAERVEIGMGREFAAALREALPTWRVCDSSCGDTVPDMTLKVDVLRLDVWRKDARLVAAAQLQIGLHRPATAAATSHTFVQALPTDDPQGQAQAMTDLLRTIADAGAAAVLRARAAQPANRAVP